MAMALIRIEGTRLSIAGAAMPPLLVWRRAGEEIEEVSLSAPPLGSPLGGEFVCKTVDLEAGDAVLVFTDGLAEVLDNKDEAWGYERVEETFARAAPRGPEASLDELFAAVEAFANGREFSDDITLVAIQA
jgi:serine phosphatase RsbU (regulator of sigma subunit)